MATRGRPKKYEDAFHKVSYYTPKPELAKKAYQKAVESKLHDAYETLYRLAYDLYRVPLTNIDKHEINLAVKQALEMI